MGQAKQRGNFEQRKQTAKAPIELITDENLVLAELKEEGLLEHFKEDKDKKIYHSKKLTIYFYFGLFDRYGVKRDEAGRGYAMYKAKDKFIYEALVKQTLNI